MTHDQYLDEPADVIQWMVRIDQIVRKAERSRDRRERQEGIA